MMQVEHVVSVLESLANGIDPTTDTPVPHQLFNSPDVIRALFTAASMLQAVPAAEGNAGRQPRTTRPPAAAVRWTEEEDAQVCREYEEGLTFTEIARKHARTTGAIMSRLVKLERIDPNTLAPRPREGMVGASRG